MGSDADLCLDIPPRILNPGTYNIRNDKRARERDEYIYLLRYIGIDR